MAKDRVREVQLCMIDLARQLEKLSEHGKGENTSPSFFRQYTGVMNEYKEYYDELKQIKGWK